MADKVHRFKIFVLGLWVETIIAVNAQAALDAFIKERKPNVLALKTIRAELA
jgi:hypothetical protein